MMHYNFLVNGEYLDINQGLSLTFKRENMAFAFGKLKLDRTASFEIPATGKNNRIFNLANNPAKIGRDTPMRTRVECYLQAGGTQTFGYLYAQSAKRDSYSCVFVSGQFLPLQNLSEKKIKECTSLNNVLRTDGFGVNGGRQPYPCWNGIAVTPQEYVGAKTTDLAVVPLDYVSSAKEKNACVNLAYLLRECRGLFGVGVQTPANTNLYPPLTAICPEFKLLEEQDLRIIQAVNSYSKEMELRDATTIIGQEGAVTYFTSDEYGENQVRHEMKTALGFLYKRQLPYDKEEELYGGVTIKFPNNFPKDLFLVAIGQEPLTSGGFRDTMPYMLKFFGDYSFKWKESGSIYQYGRTYETFGTPLAGKEVDIPSIGEKWSFKIGDKEYEQTIDGLIFIKATDIQFERSGDEFRTCVGLAPSSFSANIEISQGDLNVGVALSKENNARFYLSQFIPDISYIDLINVYRYAYGARLIFDEDTQTLSFKKYDFENWVQNDLQSRLISFDSIRRDVEGFGKLNKIEFNQNEGILYPPEKVHPSKVIYKIDNDLIKADNTIYKFPFSSGDVNFDTGHFGEWLICNDVEVSAKEETTYGNFTQRVYEKKEKNKNFTIGMIAPQTQPVTSVSSIYNYRFGMPVNDAIGKICEASTGVKAKFKLSLLEFKAIEENSFIYFEGVRYVWLSATWSNGVATFTLQKFPTQIGTTPTTLQEEA